MRNATKKPSTIAAVRGIGPLLVSANESRKSTVSTSAMPRLPATFQCTFSKVTQKNVASRKKLVARVRESTRAGGTAGSRARRSRHSGARSSHARLVSKSSPSCCGAFVERGGGRAPARALTHASDELLSTRDILLRHLREGALECRGQPGHRRRAGGALPALVRAHEQGSDATHGCDRARLLCGVPHRVPARLFQSRDEAGARPVHEGDGEVRPPLPLPDCGDHLSRPSRRAVLLARARLVRRRLHRELRVRRVAAAERARRAQPRLDGAAAADRWRERHQRLRLGERIECLPAQCTDGRSEPSRRDARRSSALADAAVPAARAGSPAEVEARARARVHAADAARDALAQRRARPSRRSARARLAVSPLRLVARVTCAAWRPCAAARVHPVLAVALLLGRLALADPNGRRVDVDALRGLRLHPPDPALASAARPWPDQLLRLLRVRDGEDELGAPLVLGVVDRRDGSHRPRRLSRVPPLCVPAPACGAPARADARRGRRSERPARAPARVGLHRGATRNDGVELLLSDDAVLLLLRLHRARARVARRLCETWPNRTCIVHVIWWGAWDTSRSGTCRRTSTER